jgi:hypothetical protein
MPATYVYAVIPAGDEVTFDVPGVADNGDDVHSVAVRDSATVVSESPVADYRGLKREDAIRHLVAHQRVVEAVMRDFPLLPVKFGTVLPSEEWARRLLEQGEAVFRPALERFARLTQMEVVVLWDLEQVFREISLEEPIARLKAAMTAQPTPDSDSARVAIGQVVHASLVRRRDGLRERIVSSLQDTALDVIVNPVMDDSMVASIAVLLDDERRGAVDGRVEALDEEFEGRLQFRCVGPLPPYSFATVEVQRPSFEAVNDARQRLGLGETATADDVRRSYRESARRLHPDHNQDDPDAEARMADLTHAYELLAAYAQSQAPQANDSRQPACCFDRQTVEQTLLVSLRRQEMDA